MVGGPEVLILVVLATFVVSLFAVIDAVRRPRSQFQAVRQRKAIWVVLNAIGLLTVFGVVLSAFYLTVVRPRLSALRPLT